MIKVLHTDTNVVMTITTGLITRKDILTITAIFRIKCKDFECVNFYCETRDYIDITIPAYFERLLFDIKYFNKIGRIAVVSDDVDARHNIMLKTKFLGIKMKLFRLTESELAKEWLQNKKENVVR